MGGKQKRIKVDDNVDAAYIHILPGVVIDSTVEVQALVDLDEAGRIVGVELLEIPPRAKPLGFGDKVRFANTNLVQELGVVVAVKKDTGKVRVNFPWGIYAYRPDELVLVEEASHKRSKHKYGEDKKPESKLDLSEEVLNLPPTKEPATAPQMQDPVDLLRLLQDEVAAGRARLEGGNPPVEEMLGEALTRLEDARHRIADVFNAYQTVSPVVKPLLNVSREQSRPKGKHEASSGLDEAKAVFGQAASQFGSLFGSLLDERK